MGRLIQIRDVNATSGGGRTAWVPKSDLSGGGSLNLETATGTVDGVNTEFIFAGTPVAVFRNGVLQSPDVVTIVGNTAIFNPAPASGEITGLTQ